MPHDRGIRYSQDPELSLAELRAQAFPGDALISEELIQWTQRHGVHRTMEGEPDFHYKLLLIKSKPYIIYYMGNLDLLHQPILGIVGPRNHSSYATEILEKLFALAPKYRFVTISGLALGVDQLCHKMSLEKGIPTIAVLGGGLRRFLRSSDRALIEQIVKQGGLVLSEFKLDQQPQTYTFPQRNRIIAGLADVLFVPEAGSKSGSLITAEYALNMHKPVYGAPNTIFSSTSTGINHLISSGAVHAVSDIQQFLDRFFTQQSADIPHVSFPDLSPDEQSLLSFIGEKQTCSLTDFLSAGSLSSQELISLLTLLEMKHCIYQESPGIYKIAV